MLLNKNTFCNTPWYELHIYWDGSLGICCQESRRLHTDDQKYNIANMSISDWFNSEPVKKFRMDVLSNYGSSACSSCYTEESHGGISRRNRSNQKSVIFISAFEKSFEQSPNYKSFEYSSDNQGDTNTHPIDLHIDLGNYCNLACKMCDAVASSTIATQHVKWGISESKKYVGQNWTKDETVWENFKKQLLEIPNLKNIHLMGGETLLTDRFEDLLDTMIEHKRFELCFSFVSNGTVFKPVIIEKLKKFSRVGLEVSIETVDQRNAYVRQGTDTELVLKNINRYIEQCNNSSITLSLRPTPTLLTIGSYIGLLKFALEKKLIVKSTLCYKPAFLNIALLPAEVKKSYIVEYKELLDTIAVDDNVDYNASNPHNYAKIIKDQILLCISLLETPMSTNPGKLLQQLVEHCKRWDQVYKLNARELYPELSEIWDKYEY